ncbi:MAG TPA: carbonic anhydrase family protein [Chitinophagaceae bacterium]|nr:carbonic anhydrase family protein [Chitinophagaceae bacterium]
MKTHTKEFLETLTPELAFEVLQEGNKRFVNNLKMNRNLLQQLNEVKDGQYPFAVVLSCMDSRTSTELIFDQGLGDIFSIRIAGNVVNDDIVGSMEYACKVVGSKLIVVLGHSRCGAIAGAVDNVEMGNLTGLLEKIKPAIENADKHNEHSHHPIHYEKVAYANVLNSIDEILERSSIIRALFREGKIGIIGGMYSVETGKVHFTRTLFNESDLHKHVTINEAITA